MCSRKSNVCGHATGKQRRTGAWEKGADAVMGHRLCWLQTLARCAKCEERKKVSRLVLTTCTWAGLRGCDRKSGLANSEGYAPKLVEVMCLKASPRLERRCASWLHRSRLFGRWGPSGQVLAVYASPCDHAGRKTSCAWELHTPWNDAALPGARGLPVTHWRAPAHPNRGAPRAPVKLRRWQTFRTMANPPQRVRSSKPSETNLQEKRMLHPPAPNRCLPLCRSCASDPDRSGTMQGRLLRVRRRPAGRSWLAMLLCRCPNGRVLRGFCSSSVRLRIYRVAWRSYQLVDRRAV